MQDNATPSGNAMAATVLLKLAAFTGNGGYTGDRAEDVGIRSRCPHPLPNRICAMVSGSILYVSKPKEIAIIGDVKNADTQAMLDMVNETYRPFVVVAVGVKDSPVPLLNGREQIDDKGTVYVCENFACKLPVNEAEKVEGVVED